MNGFLAVALGGAIGASGRHLVGMMTLRYFGPGFPWGTVAVNVLGSFAMGVMIELLALKFNATNELRLFLATGILGGFTTFSAFSLDVVLMMERKQMWLAGTYVSVSVFASIAALFAGLALIRSML